MVNNAFGAGQAATAGANAAAGAAGAAGAAAGASTGLNIAGVAQYAAPFNPYAIP